MVRLSIDVADGISGALRALWTRTERIQPALEKAGLYQQRSFMKQFDVEGVPPWKPLSLQTVMARRRGRRKAIRHRYPKILQDTGLLRRSYTTRTDSHSVWRMGRDSLTIGSAVEYAAQHQYGKNRVPARPLHILGEDWQTIQRIITDYILRGET